MGVAANEIIYNFGPQGLNKAFVFFKSEPYGLFQDMHALFQPAVVGHAGVSIRQQFPAGILRHSFFPFRDFFSRDYLQLVL